MPYNDSYNNGSYNNGMTVGAASQANINKFILGVYNWMAIGLALTGLIAWFVASQPQIIEALVTNKILFYGLIFGELGMVMLFVGMINRVSVNTAIMMFLAYAALNGVTMSLIFLIYTMESIATTFFITGGTFAATSAFGYFTKRDLTSMGGFFFMALIGFIIASIVNLFMQSTVLYWVLTYAGVLIFVGLTAYDTQKIKNFGAQVEEGTDESAKGSIMGALHLYLDFINLFLLLLRIFGNRR